MIGSLLSHFIPPSSKIQGLSVILGLQAWESIEHLQFGSWRMRYGERTEVVVSMFQ